MWRCVSLTIFVLSNWLLVKVLFYEQRYFYFFLITLLVLTPSIDALRNGQANLIFAGMLLLIGYFMVLKKWWIVSFLLAFLINVKQIGVIIAGLIIFAYPQVILKLGIFIVMSFILPFLFSNPDYVISQYISAIQEMNRAVNTNRNFADINGFLSLFGLKLEGLYSIVIRALAGFLTLFMWLYIQKRFFERYALMFFLILSSGYLMLFHPMTEQNSYVIIATPIVISALMIYTNFKMRYTAYALMFVCVSLGVLPELVRPLLPNLGMWYKPFSIIVVYYMLFETFRRSSQSFIKSSSSI